MNLSGRLKEKTNKLLNLHKDQRSERAHTTGSVTACFCTLLQPEAVSAEVNLSQMPARAEKCPKTTAYSAKSPGATDVYKKFLSHDRRGRVLKPKALPLCVPAGTAGPLSARGAARHSTGRQTRPSHVQAGQQQGATHARQQSPRSHLTGTQQVTSCTCPF